MARKRKVEVWGTCKDCDLKVKSATEFINHVHECEVNPTRRPSAESKFYPEAA